MQYQPGAAELLATIAEVLEDDLLPVLPDAERHRGRVAASLTRILQREAELGAETAARERERLAALLGHVDDSDGGDDADADTDAAAALSRELVERIRADDTPDFQRQAWEALVAIARDDLAIAKPGYDSWEGP